jgi:hypothetical protein
MKTVLLLCCASIVPAFAQNKTEWFGFASYPGARQLCDQNLMGLDKDTTLSVYPVSATQSPRC